MDVIQSLIKAASITMLRYGGGSYADYYDWQTNTNIQNCLPNNYGNTTSSCTSPDYGFFTSSSPPAAQTPYYGYLLASILAQPHAVLRTLATSDPSGVLAFESVLPDGKHALAFLNTSTSSAETVMFKPRAALFGTLRTWS